MPAHSAQVAQSEAEKRRCAPKKTGHTGLSVWLFSCVIVDETAGEDHVSLLSGEILHLQRDLPGTCGLDQGGGNGLVIALQSLPNAGNGQLIAGLNVQ